MDRDPDSVVVRVIRVVHGQPGLVRVLPHRVSKDDMVPAQPGWIPGQRPKQSDTARAAALEVAPNRGQRPSRRSAPGGDPGWTLQGQIAQRTTWESQTLDLGRDELIDDEGRMLGVRLSGERLPGQPPFAAEVHHSTAQPPVHAPDRTVMEADVGTLGPYVPERQSVPAGQEVNRQSAPGPRGHRAGNRVGSAGSAGQAARSGSIRRSAQALPPPSRTDLPSHRRCRWGPPVWRSRSQPPRVRPASCSPVRGRRRSDRPSEYRGPG